VEQLRTMGDLKRLRALQMAPNERDVYALLHPPPPPPPPPRSDSDSESEEPDAMRFRDSVQVLAQGQAAVLVQAQAQRDAKAEAQQVVQRAQQTINELFGSLQRLSSIYWVLEELMSDGAQLFLSALPQMQTLTSVRFSIRQSMDSFDLTPLLELPNLHSFTLASEPGPKSIAVLRKLQALRVLHTSNRVGQEALTALLAPPREPGALSQVQEVELSLQHVRAALFEALCSLPSLTILKLPMLLTPHFACLGQLRHLHTVRIAPDRELMLQPAELDVLVASLRQCVALTDVTVSLDQPALAQGQEGEPGGGPTFAEMLAEAVPGVRKLGLFGMRLPRASLAFLRRMPLLEELSFRMCHGLHVELLLDASILPCIQEIDVRRCVVPYADKGGGDRHWNDSNLTKEQVALFAIPCTRLPTLQRFSYTP
jgi:hypothetical protein